MTTFRAACVQVTASNDMAANIGQVSALVRQARDEGADFITTPEAVVMIERGRENILAKAAPEESHPGVAAFRDLARETGAWLLSGSFAVTVPEEDRLANRSMLFDPEGEIVARYDKIHMFDIDLPNGESYRESRVYRPGDRAMLTRLPWATLGMTVCYDMRFPHLYRDLAKLGAEVLTVPSAFTRPTGRAHWHVLLRARAIETGCFVIAAAQCGEHAGGRGTYGHSIIIGPWGDVLAEAGEAPGVITADIDIGAVSEARGRVPSLQHDREYAAAQPPEMAAAAAE
jgi:predicted amidohydrolase